MNIVKSFSAGFKRTLGITKIVTVIYSITLLFVLTIALSFNAEVGNLFIMRMGLYKLLQDFDFTLYSDLMNNYSFLFKPFVQMAIWLGLFYFLFTVFFAGGVIKSFEGSIIKSKTQAFFGGCAKFFFRFLRLGIYTLTLQLIIHSTIAAVFGIFTSNLIETSAEPSIFTLLVVWFSIHLLFFIIISIISDYAKIILVKEDSGRVWKALLESLIFTFRRFHFVFLLYIILITVPAANTLLYILSEIFVGMHSGLTVLIMFLVQQGYIWIRLFSKIWILAGEYEFYNSVSSLRTQPLLTQEIITGESL